MNGPLGIDPTACFYGLNFGNACGGTEAADVRLFDLKFNRESPRAAARQTRVRV
jgi:hypothetical protein